MPVVITYTGATPTVDADEDVWGNELNDDALGPIKTDLDALAAQGNASETAIGTLGNYLPKAGGTMTGPLALAATPSADPREAGFRRIPVRNFDANITLATTDDGYGLRQNGATGRTVTIPATGLPVGFCVSLRPFSPQPISIAVAGGVTLRHDGSSASITTATVPSFGRAFLWQEDPNIWTISGAV